MSFWSDLGKGITSYYNALIFVFKEGLWYYFVFPIVITGLLYLLGMYSVDLISSWITDRVIDYYGGGGVTSYFLRFFSGTLSSFVSSMIGPILTFFASAFLSYLVLICCSPVMSSLSEKTDRIISGKTPDMNFPLFMRNILRALLVVMRNLVLQGGISLGLMLIWWLPVIGWLAFPFFYIFNWYFAGMNIMDYTYERRKLSISQSVRITRQNKGLAIANGFVFSMLLLIPYAGISLAVVLAPVAATIPLVEKMDKK